MPLRKYTKICSVCGDKACCFHFGAISCDSCKSFFRRNAYKQNSSKCRFDKKTCIIDKETRKICLKCRLDKCIAVGMKPEKILDLKGKGCKNNTVQASDNSKHDNCISSDVIDFSSIVTSTTPVFLDIKMKGSSDLLDLNDLTVESCNENIQKNNHSNNEEKYEISEHVYQKALELELTVLPVSRPLSSNFNEFECNYLTELLSATVLLRKISPYSPVIIDTLNDLVQFIIDKSAACRPKFTQLTKGLSSFKMVCEFDKMTLFKYGIIEVLFMRSARQYNIDNNTWTLSLDENNSFIFDFDLLKKFKRNVFEPAKRYMSKILMEWDSDSFILDLLMVIILFEPNRPNLIDSELIKSQQNIYMYLLQRYLYMKCGTECEAKTKFLRIINALEDIREVNDIIRGRNINCNIATSGSFSTEILDI